MTEETIEYSILPRATIIAQLAQIRMTEAQFNAKSMEVRCDILRTIAGCVAATKPVSLRMSTFRTEPAPTPSV